MDAVVPFDEDRFPPLSRYEDGYWAKVRKGYERMRQTSVVICGLVRDSYEALGRTIPQVEATGELFDDFSVVVYENDSKDLTRMVLQGWQRDSPYVHLMGENRDDPVNPPLRCLERAARMAYYRNQVRQEVAQEYTTFPYVIVIDLDLAGWSLDGLANTFGHDGWDFVGANGLLYQSESAAPVHYDAWAWRWHGSYSPVKNSTVNTYIRRRGEPMEQVYSCFGGLGVYRMEAFQKASYSGSDCEHVPLHRKMREAGLGRQFFNPSQLTLY